MAGKVFHYCWRRQLAASPDELWPLVADTNRFNKETGPPPVKPGVATDRLPNARRRLGFSKMGVRIAWEEEPFQWVEPSRFSVVRRYTRGPVAETRVLAELAPAASGGTNLSYQVWAVPSNLLGRLAIPIQIGIASARSFAESPALQGARSSHIGCWNMASERNVAGRDESATEYSHNSDTGH